jgi:hypothetical protein
MALNTTRDLTAAGTLPSACRRTTDGPVKPGVAVNGHVKLDVRAGWRRRKGYRSRPVWTVFGTRGHGRLNNKMLVVGNEFIQDAVDAFAGNVGRVL